MKFMFFSVFILCFVMSTIQCMESSDINLHKISKKDAYDCEILKAEYALYTHLSQDEKNCTFDAILKKWIIVRNQYFLPGLIKYVQEHADEQEALSDNLAALVCHGVNPNRVVVKNVSRSHGHNGIFLPYENRDYLCALDYAINTNNTRLASFLLQHNAWPYTHWLTWFASVKDFFFGETPKYSKTITRVKQNHVLEDIYSLVMAEIIAPHTGVACTFAERKTIAHHIAEKKEYPIELLDYYSALDETLIDKPDKHKNTPLHRLAQTCEYVNYFSDVRKKTIVFAQRTKNINAVNKKGQTAFDIAESACNCERFMEILKAHGGKPASALHRDNSKQKFNYDIFECDESGRE